VKYLISLFLKLAVQLSSPFSCFVLVRASPERRGASEFSRMLKKWTGSVFASYRAVPMKRPSQRPSGRTIRRWCDQEYGTVGRSSDQGARM
jgi:hypothetical protein